MAKFALIMLINVAAFLVAGGLVVKLQLQPVIERHKELYLPLKIEEWQGGELALTGATQDIIRPDSYLFRNYRRGDKVINLYVGYYGSLKKSDAAHIPSLCYPAQGWRIVEQGETLARIKGRAVPFNRLKVQRGKDWELVYYGFKTSTLMTGSLYRLRTELARSVLFGKETDNALIRFSVPLASAAAQVGDATLQEFIGEAYPLVEGVFGSGGNNDKTTIL